MKLSDIRNIQTTKKCKCTNCGKQFTVGDIKVKVADFGQGGICDDGPGSGTWYIIYCPFCSFIPGLEGSIQQTNHFHKKLQVVVPQKNEKI